MGKIFHTRKVLFRLKQVLLAAFLAVLKLKAEKQQQIHAGHSTKQFIHRAKRS